jgi:hypothetical protein
MLDNHKHPTESMIIICQGTVYLTGEINQHLSESDIVCVPSGKMHGFRTDNEQLLERHPRNALFQLFACGSLQTDMAQRQRFLEAQYVWASYFQKMIYARLNSAVQRQLPWQQMLG